MAGERLLLTSAPEDGGADHRGPSSFGPAGVGSGASTVASKLPSRRRTWTRSPGATVGGAGDQVAVGALGQAEAALEHLSGDSAPSLPLRPRWRGGARRAPGGSSPPACGAAAASAARCSTMRRCGCARWRRISAARSSAARGGQAPGEDAPPALDRLVEALPPLVEQPARIAEARAQPAPARGARRAADSASARPPRRCRSASSARRSASTGTASSAAADGVGARRSATKSAMVKSVSWPTAEITGTRQATMARATGSSLKAQRSSSEPPPRATMMTSTSGDRGQAAQRRRDRQRRALALHRRGREQDRHRKRAGARRG